MAGPDFGKMIGPLPLGAWLAAVGGGVGLYWFRGRSAAPGASADGSTVEDTSGVPGVGDGSTSAWVQTQPPANPDAPVSTKPTTNDEWGQQAINWLISMGYDATVSDSAIRKYLQGGTLTATEFVLVRQALMHLGATPQLLPPPEQAAPVGVPVTPAPTPKPVPKPAPKPVPAHYTYYKVKRGDNLTKIAKAYHTTWQTIYNNNRAGKRRRDGKMGMILHPNLILPGWVLLIK
jgi:hypothetical protein